MRKKDLIRLLKESGYRPLRVGSNHVIYERDGHRVPVSHGQKIKDRMFKSYILHIAKGRGRPRGGTQLS